MPPPAAPGRRVLMVAFHFPPLAGSSGIQRTLRFVQHLPQLGWEPLVLSVHPRAYERTSDDLLAEVPPGTVLHRAWALDTARHLSIGGRYLGALARPDRWMTWRFDAVRQGMALIRRFRPAAIWTTYPIATAHVIGAELRRRSGLPWVADFRDPMAQDGYPADPRTWAAFSAIEARAIREAAAATFTTPGAARIYRERYPAASERILTLENGYDEPTFAAAEAAVPRPAPLCPGRIVLLHSGIVYPEERDPTALLNALQRLRHAQAAAAQRLTLRFRAPVHDKLLRRLAAERGVQDMVEVLPPLPYQQALQEMRAADALLTLQSAGCNEQVPAKLYEYLRAGRPLLTLTDPAGDTAGVVRAAGIDAIAPLDDAAAIAALLERFVAALDAGRAPMPHPDAVRRASRLGRSMELAALLERVTSERRVRT